MIFFERNTSWNWVTTYRNIKSSNFMTIIRFIKIWFKSFINILQNRVNNYNMIITTIHERDDIGCSEWMLKFAIKLWKIRAIFNQLIHFYGLIFFDVFSYFFGQKIIFEIKVYTIGWKPLTGVTKLFELRGDQGRENGGFLGNFARGGIRVFIRNSLSKFCLAKIYYL